MKKAVALEKGEPGHLEQKLLEMTTALHKGGRGGQKIPFERKRMDMPTYMIVSKLVFFSQDTHSDGKDDTLTLRPDRTTVLIRRCSRITTKTHPQGISFKSALPASFSCFCFSWCRKQETLRHSVRRISPVADQYDKVPIPSQPYETI